MKAGEILINGIFNGSRLLEVPFYQRAYVWDEEQWDRFLADMEFVTKTFKPYFVSWHESCKNRDSASALLPAKWCRDNGKWYCHNE